MCTVYVIKREIFMCMAMGFSTIIRAVDIFAPHAHFHTLSYTLSLTYAPNLTYAHTLTLPHSHARFCSHSHTPTIPRSLSLSLMQPRPHPHPHPHLHLHSRRACMRVPSSRGTPTSPRSNVRTRHTGTQARWRSGKGGELSCEHAQWEAECRLLFCFVFFLSRKLNHTAMMFGAHIKRSPNSRCVFLSGIEDTTKMTNDRA